ncbi:putative homing endonuclease [Salmonella phage vB_SalM-LPST94]|nr:putative homing endonuclease [Salmonella phage vB_SalM-LPST94]
MIYAYKIETITNGKVYIGVTNDPQRRYDQHFANAFHHGVQSELYDAMRKYGTSGFTFVVIA